MRGDEGQFKVETLHLCSWGSARLSSFRPPSLFAASGHPAVDGVVITCSDKHPRISSHFQVDVTLDKASELEMEKDASKLVKVRQPNTLHNPLSCTQRKHRSVFAVQLTRSVPCVAMISCDGR